MKIQILTIISMLIQKKNLISYILPKIIKSFKIRNCNKKIYSKLTRLNKNKIIWMYLLLEYNFYCNI